MENKVDSRSRNLILITVIAGALLMGAPLVLEKKVLEQPQCDQKIHPDVYFCVSKFFELDDKLGEAVLIAGLIGVIVDKTFKKTFIKEVVQQASPQLIGRHLPGPVSQALLGYFDIHFVRPVWEIVYKLKPLVDDPDFVEIQSRIAGKLTNCGAATEEFPFRCSIDPSPNKLGIPDSLFTRIRMEDELGNVIFDFNPPDNASLRQNDGTKLFERRVSCKPGHIYRTILEATEYHPSSFSMTLFSGTTVVRSEIEIDHKLSDFDVQVSTGTSENLKGDDLPWGKKWTIERPLLTGQGIVATWNPITSSSVQAKPSTNGATPPMSDIGTQPTLNS